LPLLNDPGHQHIVKSLQTRVPSALHLQSAQQPKAILLLTAHWETELVTISSARKHDLYYDYYGFPAEAYHLEYDAPGDPATAELVSTTLATAGIKSVLDPKRGMSIRPVHPIRNLGFRSLLLVLLLLCF
jgi:aromatic ring-opening dioxygenase catalytic subunit (LigB family)